MTSTTEETDHELEESSTEILESHQTEGKRCVMYGLCGDLEETCKVNQPPAELDEEYVEQIEEYCPELIEEYGTNLCCDESQVEELTKNLKLAKSMIGRCPSCFNNFRRSFCEFTCSPYQYKFLNVTKVSLTTSDDALTDSPQEVVRSIDFYISRKYIEGTFESCKNVLMSSTNGPALDILCGPWGSYRCTAERWFTFLGSTSNSYSPFDIIYRPIDTDEEPSSMSSAEVGLASNSSSSNIESDFEPLNLPTYGCAEAPPVSVFHLVFRYKY